MIYHSEEESDLDTFVYIFRHTCHSSSFLFYPKLSKARVIVVGGEWNWTYTPRGTYAQIFLRFGLLISWPLYFYNEKTALKYVYPQKWTCTPKWKHQGVHVPPNRNMSGHAMFIIVIFWYLFQLDRTYDKHEDADLWRDGWFGSRVTRYLCVERCAPQPVGIFHVWELVTPSPPVVTKYVTCSADNLCNHDPDRPRVYKTVFMLNSTEHKISTANKN